MMPLADVGASVADHPLPYVAVALGLIALLLFLVFGGGASTTGAVGDALFKSPLSITLLAALLFGGLQSQLPAILKDQDWDFRGLGPHTFGLYIAIGVAALVWLLLLARWSISQRPRKRKIPLVSEQTIPPMPAGTTNFPRRDTVEKETRRRYRL